MIGAARADLDDVVERAYRQFAKYDLAGGLVVCNCGVCVDERTQALLETTPLREISSDLLAEYTNSAHGIDEESSKQLRHFLPRYFELIAADDEPDALGGGISLRRMGQVDWLNEWPREEGNVAKAFFDAWVTFVTNQDGPWDWKWSERRAEDALITLVSAGADYMPAVARWLSPWTGEQDLPRALHLAITINSIRWDTRRLCSAHWESYVEDSARLVDMLSSNDAAMLLTSAIPHTRSPDENECVELALSQVGKSEPWDPQT